MTTQPGYAGAELWIDLTTGQSSAEPLRGDLRRYIGGAGYAARLFYDRMEAGTDPLGPDNLLLVGTGPLTDQRVPGGGSIEICFKSPLTGAWGESRMGCDVGFALRKAGYDFLIVQGAAENPVYAVVDNDGVTLKDASHLAGRHTLDKEAAVRDEVGQDYLVLSIGPAGEQGVLFSSVMHSHRAAGRCGGGAVMGSKNLLAIAVKGAKEVTLADQETFAAKSREFHKVVLQNPVSGGFKEGGTMMGYAFSDASGDLPTRNWQSNSFGKGKEVATHFQKKNLIRARGCYSGCTMQCGRWLHVPDGPYATPEHEGGEYESISAFTAFIGNENVDAAVHASWLCNEYGLDTISAGAQLAFLMECREQGIVSEEDLEGLHIAWNQPEDLAEGLRRITYREGRIYSLLADGVRAAAKELGPRAEELAIHVKGLEGPAHDPRGGKSLALTYGTAPRGLCHIHPFETSGWDGGKGDNDLQPYGLRDPNEVDALEEHGKGNDVAILQDAGQLPDVLVTCKFYMFSGMNVDRDAELLNAATGWEMTGRELLEVGERTLVLERLFNMREGLSRKDDLLPEKMRRSPAFGKFGGKPESAISDYEGMLDEYYEARGWDKETGAPKQETLERLGLA
ncbi:MAG: aldehyde ferredoxin oxidoreductase family protein [Synergistales bacterium]|nr:aldehyde ferredoxin oxidoreductase family protein [Synergistales bacterium]